MREFLVEIKKNNKIINKVWLTSEISIGYIAYLYDVYSNCDLEFNIVEYK